MKAEAKILKTETVNTVMGIKEWSLIVILSILWGGSFFFVGVTVKEMPPLTLIVEQPWNLSPSSTSLMAMFGLAAISTSLAYIIYFRVLAAAGATNLLLVTFLIPLSAILLGVTVLGEQLEWNAFRVRPPPRFHRASAPMVWDCRVHHPENLT